MYVSAMNEGLAVNPNVSFGLFPPIVKVNVVVAPGFHSFKSSR